MFGVDDFAIWFAWYFVGDLASHPATKDAVGRVGSAVVGEPPPPPPQAVEPDAVLDWLTEPSGARAPLFLTQIPDSNAADFNTANPGAANPGAVNLDAVNLDGANPPPGVVSPGPASPDSASSGPTFSGAGRSDGETPPHAGPPRR